MALGELLSLSTAVLAVLMLGSGRLRLNLLAYSAQTFLVAAITLFHASAMHNRLALVISLTIVIVKAVGIPGFLGWVISRIDITNDRGTMLPIPLSMHLSIVLLGVAYLLAHALPHSATGFEDASAAISLVLTGLMFMLTRRSAVSQIIGFLTMENGIYLFGLSQTKGMPMLIEMGIFLDVLVGVMIAGLIIFRIKKSFEHIDVTELTGLRD